MPYLTYTLIKIFKSIIFQLNKITKTIISFMVTAPLFFPVTSIASKSGSVSGGNAVTDEANVCMLVNPYGSITSLTDIQLALANGTDGDAGSVYEGQGSFHVQANTGVDIAITGDNLSNSSGDSITAYYFVDQQLGKVSTEQNQTHNSNHTIQVAAILGNISSQKTGNYSGSLHVTLSPSIDNLNGCGESILSTEHSATSSSNISTSSTSTNPCSLGYSDFIYNLRNINDPSTTFLFCGSPISLDVDNHDWDVNDDIIKVNSIGSTGNRAEALLDYDGDLGNSFTFNAEVKTHSGNNRYWNGGILFDYQDANNYKVVMARVGQQQWTIEEVINGQRINHAELDATIEKDIFNAIQLKVEGTKASLITNGEIKVSHDFGEALNDGRFGIFNNNAETSFKLDIDNL